MGAAGAFFPDRTPRPVRWKKVGHRFNSFSNDGTFERILQVVPGQAHAAGLVDWTAPVDPTIAPGRSARRRRTATRKGGAIELQEFLVRAG